MRFADNAEQPVSELMTKENLVTVNEGVDMAEASRLLHKFRIEKLLRSTQHTNVLVLLL